MREIELPQREISPSPKQLIATTYGEKLFKKDKRSGNRRNVDRGFFFAIERRDFLSGNSLPPQSKKCISAHFFPSSTLPFPIFNSEFGPFAINARLRPCCRRLQSRKKKRNRASFKFFRRAQWIKGRWENSVRTYIYKDKSPTLDARFSNWEEETQRCLVHTLYYTRFPGQQQKKRENGPFPPWIDAMVTCQPDRKWVGGTLPPLHIYLTIK